MKKDLIPALILGILLAAGPAAASRAERFSLWLAGGVSAIGPSDLNHFLSDFFRWNAESPGRSLVGGGLKTLAGSEDYEFAVLIPAGPRLQVLIGGSLMISERKNNDFSVASAYQRLDFSRTDRLETLGARIGILYVVPLSERFALRPHFSLDGYWSTFHDSGTRASGFGEDGESWVDSQWSVNCQAFDWGWTLGLALEAKVYSRLALTLDAGFRRARISGYHGTSYAYDSGSEADDRDFNLLYFESSPASERLRLLNLPEAPAGGTPSVLRDAMIDLSGWCLKAGLRISF